MEKIDIKKIVNNAHKQDSTDLENALSWSLCELMNEEDIIKAKTGRINVEIKLNGREVKFSKLITLLVKNYNREVEKEAKEIADSVLLDIRDKVEDILERFTDSINDLRADTLNKIEKK